VLQSLQHLRFSFSFLLLPIFLWGCALAQQGNIWQGLALFIILHVGVYPASNGFNSYYDRDEESIGGLEKPPPVNITLLYTSLGLDLVATLWALYLNVWLGLAIFIYGLASKAYSYDKIRLKKLPFTSWLTVGFFQGFFTVWITYQGLCAVHWTHLPALPAQVLWGAVLSSLMLMGSYPMTQVYQHNEDGRRGDKTLSILLGIRGTFLFTSIVFAFVTTGYVYFLYLFFGFYWAIAYPLALMPVLAFFQYWAWQVWKNPKEANFKNAMRLNLLSAVCLNVFFAALWLVTLYSR